MSARGYLRSSLAASMRVFVADRKLPYPEADPDAGDGGIRAPVVLEQSTGINAQAAPECPAVIVHVGADTETETDHTALVSIVTQVYAEDNEQGYRDAENLAEAIKVDLKQNPWVADGAFTLGGPWVIDVPDESQQWPIFKAIVTCVADMPAASITTLPDGRPIEEII